MDKYKELKELDFLRHIAFLECICAQNGYTLNLEKEYKDFNDGFYHRQKRTS